MPDELKKATEDAGEGGQDQGGFHWKNSLVPSSLRTDGGLGGCSEMSENVKAITGEADECNATVNVAELAVPSHEAPCVGQLWEGSFVNLTTLLPVSYDVRAKRSNQGPVHADSNTSSSSGTPEEAEEEMSA
eukprot:59524-Pelagomonas_calceolata.AAC.4